MADAKQVQIRRDTAAILETVVPVEAELGYDQTNRRLVVGDGSVFGGVPHQNYIDARNSVFNRGTVGGTANAITLTMSPAPASYQTGMRLTVILIATNTSSTTINVNALGNRSVRKTSVSGVTDVVAGDLVSGGIYDMVYDGTQFVLMNSVSATTAQVGQGQLKTSTQSFSTGVDGEGLQDERIILSGGAYGFSIQSYISGSAYDAAGWVYANITNTAAYSVVPVLAGVASASLYGMQRYVTSSPPYDMGDGEAAGFFFVLVNDAGEIKGHYAADTPPWAYNGPTDIKCASICPVTGKKFRRVLKRRTFEEYMDGAEMKYILEEITHDVKNADMSLIPSPFLGHDPSLKTVLLDPTDYKIRKIIDFQNAGGGSEFLDELQAGKFQIDNTECRRCGPKGVSIHKMKYKYKGKF